MAQIATLVYTIGIAGLFWLDREKNVRTSRALWLSVVWLLINGSRPVSVWLGMGPSNSSDMYLEGSPLDRNIYLMLVTAGVIVLWGRQSTVKRFLRVNPAVIAFFIYCAISSVWAEHPDVSFKRWIKAVGDVVMVLIVLTDRERLYAVKRILARTGFILIPVSVLLIKYYPDMARYYSRWEGKMFVAGVAEDKNMLGMTCLAFGLGAWWRLLGALRDYKGRKRMRLLLAHGVLLSMAFWLFWMANSMTSMSCFLMAGAAMTVTSLFRFARGPVVAQLLIMVTVCISFSVLFLNIGGGALESMGRNSTLTGRTEIWQGLLKLGANPVLGTGFQSFWVGQHLLKVWSMGDLLNGINESHNAYLEIFLNLGGIGLTLLFFLLIIGYRNIVYRTPRNSQDRMLWLGFFIATIIYGFTEASAFGSMNPMWFGFLLATMTVPKSANLKRVASSSGEDGPRNVEVDSAVERPGLWWAS